jgi:hypothetical protein
LGGSERTHGLVLIVPVNDEKSREARAKGKINMKLQKLIYIVIGIVCIGLLPGAHAVNPPSDEGYPEGNTAEGQNRVPSSSPFQVGAATHETRADAQAAPQFPNASENNAESETVSSARPTRSSFMATWDTVPGATGYLLDVSTSDSFSDYVDGYHDLDVGNVKGRVVTGLNPGTTYYYRVRPYTSSGPASFSGAMTANTPSGAASYSGAMTTTTVATTGLNIQATFDSSITGHPNAVAIEAMINRAISIYESLFSDPITIKIRFRYATTAPNGTPLTAGLAHSYFVYYTIPWNTAGDLLRADARTSNDNLAIASLPVSPLSANIIGASANGRAVGLNTPPAMFANGSVGQGGPYDGIVTLNSAAPYQVTRPTSWGKYDAQSTTEHEIDEVMGLGSWLSLGMNDLRPQDVFSWSSPGVRNLTSSGTRYFSINGGVTNLVNFNQNPNGDFGDWFSTACPQAHPYVQNAFGCPGPGQSSDVRSTSPEGINLDVIGYDLVNAVVATKAATNITSSSATLNGTVDPNAITTTVHFQYGTTTNYGSTTANRTYTGNMTQSVSANISGLSPNTTYHFRLVETNNGGTKYGSDRTFRTFSPTGPPVVTTSTATNVASFSATLKGSVYPHGLPTTVYFQYGTTTHYGLTTAPQTKTGSTYQNVSANISGLSAHTTYHFRIVASNAFGTRYGTDRTFTTQ